MIYVIHTGYYSDRGVRCVVSHDGNFGQEQAEEAERIRMAADEMFRARWDSHRQAWFDGHKVEAKYSNYPDLGYQQGETHVYFLYARAYRDEYPDSIQRPDYFNKEMERLGATLLAYEEIDLD